MTDKFHQQGGLATHGPFSHINCPDVLKRGWCFDMDEDDYCARICRTKEAKNPLRCWCGLLAISKDHLHPYHSEYTLCRKHWESRNDQA